MITDVHVSLMHWPFRRLPGDETPALVARLQGLGVTQAWAGSFEALLHRDLAAVNHRLAGECRQHGGGLLIPFGSVNPLLPDFQDDLRRCTEQHGMRGIRLYPNYHGYTLNDPSFARLLELAADRQLVVQIALLQEDERTLHPLVRVSPVSLTPLLKLVSTIPVRLVLLNCFRNPRLDLFRQLEAAGNVYFEIATLEGVGGVAKLLESISVERVLFGSHFPFFYPESAVLKLRESALSEEALQSIRSHNAARVLEPT